MRTVIVGATGHIGTYLVPRLVTAGHEVVAVSRGLREAYHDSEAWQSVQHEYVDRDAAEGDGSFGATIAALAPDVVVDLICFDVASATHIVGARAAEITRDHVLHSPDASIAKARARLGFQPRYTVVGAAREAVSYLLTMSCAVLDAAPCHTKHCCRGLDSEAIDFRVLQSTWARHNRQCG